MRNQENFKACNAYRVISGWTGACAPEEEVKSRSARLGSPGFLFKVGVGDVFGLMRG